MDIDFPLHFGGRGQTVLADEAKHVRDMIEQLLFTNSGERVKTDRKRCSGSPGR